MDPAHPVLMRAVVRAAVVAALGILVGYLLYGAAVFVTTMRAFQFFMNSVTIGVAYGSLRTSSIRNGVAALFVWYVVLTGLIEEYNSWLLALNLSYIGVLALATYIHQRVGRTRLGRNAFQRVVLAGVIIAVGDGLAVVALAVFALQAVLSRFGTWADAIYLNLQLGALIGLATGCGMEIAEAVVGRFLGPRQEAP
jgi:hypothetical protein